MLTFFILFIAAVPAIVELFHIIKHLEVIVGLRRYSFGFLVRHDIYFILDVLTSCFSIALSYHIIPSAILFVMCTNVLGHIFYIYYWPGSFITSPSNMNQWGLYLTYRIIHWTSKEYTGNHYNYDFFLTLLFDVFTHCVGMYFNIMLIPRFALALGA